MGALNEKKVLAIVAAIIISLLSYNFMFKPKQKENDGIESQISELENKYNDLVSKESQRPKLEKEIIELGNQIKVYDDKMPAKFTQEEIVMLVNYINKDTNIVVNNVAITPYEPFYPIDEIPGQSKEVAYSTSVTINYEGQYGEVMSFLEYFKNYTNYSTVTSFSMENEIESNKMTGQIIIKLYILDTGDREVPKVPEYPGKTGKDSLVSATLDAEDYEDVVIVGKDNKDLYISLTTPYADMAPVIVGISSDKTGASEVKSTLNGVNNIRIELTLVDGVYSAAYSINGVEYNKKNITVEKNIDIEVYSQIRAKEGDNVEVNATIINNTDLPVLVRVYNEDPNSPRFTLGATEGSGTVEVVK